MNDRLAKVAGAASVAFCLTGCSAPPQVTSEQSATVTVGGSTVSPEQVSCDRWQWFWTIDVGDASHGAEAVFLLNGTAATAKWVKIRDLDGFTGSYWEGGAGSQVPATVSVAGTRYTIAGNAYGYGPNNPNKPGTESFRIVASC